MMGTADFKRLGWWALWNTCAGVCPLVWAVDTLAQAPSPGAGQASGQAAGGALAPQVQVLLNGVEVTYDSGTPANVRQVTITTADGRSETVHQPTRKGDPDMPLTDRELDAKFLELATPVLGAAAAASLLERLWRLDTCAVEDLHGPGGRG